MHNESLNASVQRLRESLPVIEGVAKELGLDPFTTNFTVVTADEVYKQAGYGIPGRFSHWTHGRDTDVWKTRFDYGLSRIYELVIPTDPAEAFLLQNNSYLKNVAVIAHVLGHSDFVKNNLAFAFSNKKMIQSAVATAEAFDRYEFEYGVETVEQVVDSVKMIDTHIDLPRYKDQLSAISPKEYEEFNKKRFKDSEQERRRKSGEFDPILSIGLKKEEKPKQLKIPLPSEKESDLLYFIANFSRHLADWERDAIFKLREEAYYFYPVGQTKIMNEGWAAYWHRKLVHHLGDIGFLTTDDIVEFADFHAGVVQPYPTGINPYAVGLEIWEDIDRRSKGEPHPTRKVLLNWLGEAIDQKLDFDIQSVRRNVISDAAFLREFLADYLVGDLDLYKFAGSGEHWVVTDTGMTDAAKVREKLISMYDQPRLSIAVGGLDYNSRGELYIIHEFDGRELRKDWTDDTLKGARRLWRAPIHLETVSAGKRSLITCSGDDSVSRVELKP